MAIVYKKGKPLEYTGIDKAAHDFGSTLERVKSVGKKVVKAVASAPKKYVKAVGDANARKAKADAARELDEITRAFGSVEKYEQLYPDTKKRHETLRKTAGY